MPKPLKYWVLGKFADKHALYVKRMNSLISEISPKKERARVIILALGENARPDPGKISNPEKFFHSFCNVLARCGISSVYVHGMDNLERELSKQNLLPTILINLVQELYDEYVEYEIPDRLLLKFSAEFDSFSTAKIIRDKKKANLVLSSQGIAMPSLDPENEKIFSNVRVGSKEPVTTYGSSRSLDSKRYNTKFIDTQFDYDSKTYYTCIRLICIGSIIVQIYARASDVDKGNPSVHNADTPLDNDLLDRIYKELVVPKIQQFRLLAQNIESVLGPGFYVHDILVEKETGELYLSEVGFKFYDQSYSSPMMGVTDDRDLLTGVMDIETYAAYAASVFVTYCAGKGFI